MTQIVLLVSLLFLGIGFGLPLWNQVRQFSKDLPVGRKIVADFQTNNEPKINGFIASLQNFARTNPDFAPILAKYGLAAASPAGPALAVPAAALPKK